MSLGCKATTAVEQAFHQRMHAAHVYGLWESASELTRHPEPMAICLWEEEKSPGASRRKMSFISPMVCRLTAGVCRHRVPLSRAGVVGARGEC